MNNTRIFQNTWTLQQLPVTFKLCGIEWRFLLCSDGQTPVYAIQQRLGLSEKESEAILGRLCHSGLLTEKPVSLDEYARGTIDTPSSHSTPQTFQDYLKEAELAAVERPKEKNAPSFSPLQKPSIPAANIRSMSLQSVIQFILNQSPDPTAGHLATYRVFMGINTQLLKRNGITSLRFQDDRLITDPELQAVIAENIQKVLRVTCPEDVFSNVPQAAQK